MTCKRSIHGEDYLGNLTTSKNGKPCQPWTDTLRNLISKYTRDTEKACRPFPLGRGIFCHVGDGDIERCDVKYCGRFSTEYVSD